MRMPMFAKSAKERTRKTICSITSTAAAKWGTCMDKHRCCGAPRRGWVIELREPCQKHKGWMRLAYSRGGDSKTWDTAGRKTCATRPGLTASLTPIAEVAAFGGQFRQ